jgi:[protein-PII] uridylyltransferase
MDQTPGRAAIERQRDIIDRLALQEALEAAIADNADPARATLPVNSALRDFHARGRDEIRRRFESAPRAPASGRQVAIETSFLIDQIIRALYDFASGRIYPLANPTSGEALSLVAVGGYGRGELAPYSDIDLLFLLPYKMTAHCEQVVEYLLYRLWDLGLKVGQAARPVDECLRLARSDLTIKTSLLEARYLWGDQDLHANFRKRFAKEIASGGEEFYEAKLAERNQRHQRFGPSRYALEPNIKEGKGGLRDLQTLRWIARFLYRTEDPAALLSQGILDARQLRRLERAEAFYWTLRCQLHYRRGRAEDKLTFDVQPEIAAALGYRDRAGVKAVERLMKHYFLHARQVGEIFRAFEAAIEAKTLRRRRLRLPSIGLLRRELDGFPIDGGRLCVPRPGHFEKQPIDLIRIFNVAQKYDVEIQPLTFSWIGQSLRHVDRGLRESNDANALFLDILTAPGGAEKTLRRMNEAGVFGRFMPDFGRVVAQMQFDMYHHYTVDEHTIYALGILHRIEAGELAEEAPIATRLVRQILSRRVLYLAVLLHDIAKGRAGDHSVLGAQVAEELCPRLGLSAEETETVAWLVRHHLLLSNTAFKRDIDDPKTIADVAALVQSVERLRLLLVLTVADIRAVGPKTWNGWKAQLLRDLYNQVEEYLSGGLITAGRESEVQARLQELHSLLADWPEADWREHLARGHDGYWLAIPLASLVRQARLVREAEMDRRSLSIDYRVDSFRSMTEVTIYTPDRIGLFSQLAGAFALAGANIVEARIFTLNNGKALDVFTIQDSEGRAFDQASRLARLSATIERVLGDPPRALQGLAGVPAHINPSVRSFPVISRVLIDNKASAAHTLIEVTGRDRRGLLFYLTNALTGQNLRIANAKISTFGHRAIDTFYVKDQFGLKIEAEAKQKAVRESLMGVLEENEQPSGPSPTTLASGSAAE